MLSTEQIGRIIGKTASDWVVSRERSLATWQAGGASDVSGEAQTLTTRVSLFRDLPRGRGSATFSVADDASAAEIAREAEEAAARAGRGDGPAWRMPPSAAPARVNVLDTELASDARRVLNSLVAQLAKVGSGVSLAWFKLWTELVRTEISTSADFSSQFDATRISVEAVLASGSATQRLRRRARRSADLRLSSALSTALARLGDRQTAQPIQPGVYDVILLDDAITADTTSALEIGDARAPFSWFTPIVAQASGAAARQGLSRYQPGQSIFGEEPASGDPLTVSSDGSVARGWSSRPFGEQGEPVRRFDLVRRGMAAGLALDFKEAALRNQSPNGGVRNLVIAPGPGPLRAMRAAAKSPLEIAELAWLEADGRTGSAVAEISLGYLGGGRKQPVTGGVIAGNVFEWLARARLSSETIARAWYHGPRAIAISGVDVR